MTAQRKKTEEENNKNGIKHCWPKGTCVVIGDSMFLGIDECKMLSTDLMKVRKFPGATCSDLNYYLLPILEKTHVILHSLTNDIAHYEVTQIAGKVLKSFIIEQLPTTHILISHPTTRTYSKYLVMKIADIQSNICKIQIDLIKNGNLNSKTSKQ